MSRWCRPDLAEINRQRTRHGMTNSPEHRAWRQLQARCDNAKTPNFKNYGGRGITVCPQWRTFEAFFFDMGPRPSSLHSIERRDTNGNYCKDNCRWDTRTKQNQNTRRSRFWTIDGVTYSSSSKAAEGVGVDQATVVRWCNGYSSRGTRHPAKAGCGSFLKYAEAV